jgi:hypothetical protein
VSKLSAFLNPVSAGEEKEVVISNRFVDEKGAVVPFKIRAITQEENDEIIKKSTRRVKENGQTVERLDNVEFSRRMVVTATVEPDFTQKEMCEAYGVIDPTMVPGKMLLSGEYAKLMKEISALSGFDSIEDELKN